VLADTDGFIDTGNQEVYDRCEDAVSRAMRQIRSVAYQWKVEWMPQGVNSAFNQSSLA
jgi:hypothetical protein